MPVSPIFPLKIVPWYIRACHLFRFLHHHLNSFPFTFIIFYHAYAILYPHSSLLFLLRSNSFQSFLIPAYSTASSNPLSSPWCWNTIIYIHTISEIHNFHSLNFDLANRIWHVLKDLSCSIHKAADPTLNPLKVLPSRLNLACLRVIEMVSPHILQIENFSQNMLLCTTTREEICRLLPWHRALGWKLWNGLQRLRSDAKY